MLIGMSELAEHTSEVLRKLGSNADGFLVTRRHTDVLAAITPAGTTRHALEVPVRRLSRDTYAVINEVRDRGEAATVTNRGKPIADIRPVGEEEALRFAASVAAQSREFMESLHEADRDLAAGRAVMLDDELIESLRPASRGRRKPAQRKPAQRKPAPRKKARAA
jgi:antitoxin (DNA-binding transcriptional repressor) of toxin-antitoxin stability system